MKKCMSLLAASLLGTAAAVAQVSNDNADQVCKIERHSYGSYRKGEVLVNFKEGSAVKVRSTSSGRFASATISRVDAVLNSFGVTKMERLMPQSAAKPVGKRFVKAYNGKDIEIADVSTLYRVQYDAEKITSVYEVIEKLKELDEVEYAEPNYLVYSLGSDDVHATSCWTDPLCGQQWGLDAIKLPNLFGKPVINHTRPVIAILDTGVDLTHPDLRDNIWTNKAEQTGAKKADDDGNGFKDDIHGWDFVNNTADIRDNNGHGTHCAGIAAAMSNGIGVVGSNPEAYIMPVTVMQSDGVGDIATIIKGLDYASANGADVISMSIGTYATSIAFEQALGRAYANAVLVAAAGNDGHTIEFSKHCQSCMAGGTPCFPAAYSFVLGVESSENVYGQRAGYSNYDNTGHIYTGYDENKLYNYELRAPGSNILSTYLGGKYKALNGTSMACPLAAGAISHLLKLKEYDSKEILFGDLIHASGDGNLNIYAAYLMSDQDRQPSLELVSYRIDDSVYGDGDGRLDAGETVDIYPVIRNVWGQAKNIKCSIALAENEDPSIITILNNNVDFGSELSSYAKNSSANPIRIKVKDDCADGRHISLVIKATCTNISSDLAQDVVLSAENGVELGGMLATNTTLKAGVHYIVTSPLAVPSGVTLSIEPGTVIKFKDNTGFSCSGTLIARGEPNNLIVFTKSDLGTGEIRTFKHNSTVEYAIIEGLYELTCEVGEYTFAKGNYRNCIISNVTAVSYLLSGANFYNCNIVDNKCNTGIHTSGTLKECNIINNTQNSSFVDYLPRFSSLYNSNVFYNRSGYGYSDTGSDSTTPTVLRTTSPSYWGSAVESIVRERILDMNHRTKAQGFGHIDLSNMLTEPSSEAHGIVWKILVNGTDAQDEFEDLSPLGVGRHRFDVYFNRPMNTEVAPIISMGVREPYTQVAIAENGKWSSDGKKYTAYVTITGKTKSDGLNRIYVYGAQDDEYFEIPEEKYRFNVNVQAAGSMATGLMAEAGLGKVALNWETRETNFEDLLGFNVYRYTDANVTQVKVNSELIEPGAIEDGVMEQSFTDYSVTPGTTYYYVVKEMSTDLSQNEVSNPVAATPLTAQKGDANGSMSVDVMDVVTEVAYLTNQNPEPFIFEAADVNSDNTVNILDVVGTVNIFSAPAGARAMTVDNMATYTIEDGILYVESPVSLGGVQVNVSADKDASSFQMLEGLDGMEQANTWLSDEEYLLLAFSMSGNTIPTGKQPLMYVGDDDVIGLVACDADGKNVLAVNGTATNVESLPFGIEQSGNAEVRYYDIAGRSISADVAKKSGLYIQSIYVNGKCVKSYKMLNK